MTSAPVWLVGAVCLVLAGCAGDTPSDEATDPEAVSKDFVEAVAEASPEACELMTSSGRRFVEMTGGEGSCEEAIEARVRFLDIFSGETPPAELTQELDSGELQETREGPVFRFCLPNETEINLELVQLDGEWRVDSYVAGQEVVAISKGAKPVAQPCRID